MKFTDGFWVKPDQYTINSAIEVYKVVKTDSKVTLYCPTKKIVSRGDTLNLPLLTVEVTVPQKNIIGVRVVHHKGAIKKADYANFALNHQALTFDSLQETEATLLLQSGNLTLTIDKQNFALTFSNPNGELLHSFSKGLAEVIRYKEHDMYPFRDDKETEYHSGKKPQHFMKEELSILPGEYVYGLGEHFGPLVKNGQSIDIWNEDGGTSSSQSYKNIPFYLSNRGYGVFVNHSQRVMFEVGSEKTTRVQFAVQGEELNYYIINGPSPKQVLCNYALLTAKPSLPPAKSFGLWLSTSFCTNYNEETVLSFINLMKQNGIPFDTFHFDCFWMKGFEWCNFEFDTSQFANPAQLIHAIRAKDINVCLWINPYMGQTSPNFDECAEKGYFLKRQDGTLWQTDLWQAGMAIIDFTNPQACKWYESELEKLVKMGVNSFKTDFGERIPVEVVYYNGANPTKMHNYYSYLYNKVVFNTLKRLLGANEAIVFARSATVGCQQFPVHWGGDNTAAFASMAESLRGGLSFCLSGFGFWSHDISGFEDKATPELYRRWSQFGFLSTHTRYHGNVEYKVPWLYGDKAVQVASIFSKLKNRLMPYLYASACYTAQTGVPMMRAMLLEFNDDPTTHTLDRQYMLGDSLLVAPIFNNEGKADYYLPHGQWTNLLTNAVKHGGRWYNEVFDDLTMPLLVRPDRLILMGNSTDTANYQYNINVTVHCYALSETVTIETSVYNTKGEQVATVTLNKQGNSLTFSHKGLEGETRLVLHNRTIRKVTGGQSIKEEADTLVVLKEPKVVIEL